MDVATYRTSHYRKNVKRSRPAAPEPSSFVAERLARLTPAQLAYMRRIGRLSPEQCEVRELHVAILTPDACSDEDFYNIAHTATLWAVLNDPKYRRRR